MWMMVWRPLVVAMGVLGAAAAAVTSAISLRTLASDTLMGVVLAVMAFQAIVSIGAIIGGLAQPVSEWLHERRAAHPRPAR